MNECYMFRTEEIVLITWKWPVSGLSGLSGVFEGPPGSRNSSISSIFLLQTDMVGPGNGLGQ